MNITFAKNGKTRFVKHGFSWQIGLFGPIAFLMRSQYALAAMAAVAMYLTFMLTGFILIVVLDASANFAVVAGLAAMVGVAGHFGNRLSARDYVKKGWVPIDQFPEDWNTPRILPTVAADS